MPINYVLSIEPQDYILEDKRIGAQGRTGADGINGAAGINGTDGAAGINGIDGINGAAGADGADGLSPSVNRNPILTYTDSKLTRIDYADNKYKEFFYTQEQLSSSTEFDGLILLTKTFNYTNGVLTNITES